MGFTCQVERGIIRVRLLGILGPTDLDELTREMLELESRLSPVPDRITEFGGLTGGGVDIQFHHMLDLVEWRKRIHLPNPIRSAVVASLPVHLGYARMFQTLNDHPDITVRIFETVEAAEAWIFGTGEA